MVSTPHPSLARREANCFIYCRLLGWPWMRRQDSHLMGRGWHVSQREFGSRRPLSNLGRSQQRNLMASDRKAHQFKGWKLCSRRTGSVQHDGFGGLAHGDGPGRMAVRLRRRNTSRRQHNSRCEYSGDLASHIVLHSKSCRLFEAVGREHMPPAPAASHYTCTEWTVSIRVEILKGLF
jgi:hypothetical protein